MTSTLKPSFDAAYPRKTKTHRFCVAPMLDWMDSAYLKGFALFHPYSVRSIYYDATALHQLLAYQYIQQSAECPPTTEICCFPI